MHMYRISPLLLAGFLLLMARPAVAQSTRQFELGIGGGGLVPVSETPERPVKPYGTVYAIIPFHEMVKAEINGAYGQFHTKDFETNIIPISVHICPK